jgi:hypothetical protein
MVEKFKIGDRVLYKGMGGRRYLKATVRRIYRNKKGEVTRYSIKLARSHGLLGRWLSCSADVLSELKK